jgi:hypothetical protein
MGPVIQIFSGFLGLTLFASTLGLFSHFSSVVSAVRLVSDSYQNSLVAALPGGLSPLRSFGGQVIASIPCISPLGPSFWVTIKPAGLMPTEYIWTPITITKIIPPIHSGQQILGLADIPYACWNVESGGFLGLFSVFSYLYGQRMTYIGTSP